MVKEKIKTLFVTIIAFVAISILINPVSVKADHCNTLETNIARQDCIANPQDWHDSDAASETGTNESVDFSPQGGDLTTDTGEPIETNPIYVRLNEILNVLSVGVGIVITASVVFAGIQYITSRGDPNKTQAAIHRITQAGIALALYVFGWTILNWLIPGGVFG